MQAKGGEPGRVEGSGRQKKKKAMPGRVDGSGRQSRTRGRRRVSPSRSRLASPRPSQATGCCPPVGFTSGLGVGFGMQVRVCRRPPAAPQWRWCRSGNCPPEARILLLPLYHTLRVCRLYTHPRTHPLLSTYDDTRLALFFGFVTLAWVSSNARRTARRMLSGSGYPSYTTCPKKSVMAMVCHAQTRQR